MTVYILTVAESIMYWFCVLMVFTVFLVALIKAAEEMGVLRKHAIGITIVASTLSFLGLFDFVMGDKALVCIADSASNRVLITLILFASYPVCVIAVATLLAVVETFQTAKPNPSAQQSFDEKTKSEK